MSNIAPEHGPTPIGEIRTGPGLNPGGSRPPEPNDPLGTVTDGGPDSTQPVPDDTGSTDAY